MAGHEWDDWFEREELIGQISDIRVQNLQVEREVVQKRTFTRWMNLHLEKCNPPLEVRDLFRDIQDGKILMALLEELSGCKLLHGFKPSSHRIFRLNNIAKVLTFLEERNVKLVSIDAADVADGNSSIVLGLIWNIILFFQIKELTGNIKSQFPSSSSLSSIPTSSDSDTSHSSTPSDERKPTVAPRGHGRVIKTLLQWVQRRTRKYGVAVQDFGKSWTSGLAFLAVIKSIDPSLVDMRRALLRSARENIEEAFRTAHYSLGIPRLLEPEDVTLNPPDEQSIMTYVSQFLEHFPGIEEDETSDILERSKIGVRTNNYNVRNGVQSKRESYMVKRDSVQPPPKIFISSVSEDREQVTSPVSPRVLVDKPWASEGSPSPAGDKPVYQPLDLKQETSCSSQPSVSDSAVNSPDSWSEVPSETARQEETQLVKDDPAENSMVGEKFSTTTDEGTSDLGSPFSPESHVDRELFIDEGNYSLGSMDSLHAKSTQPTEEDEEEAYNYILDIKEEESANYLPNEDMRNKSDSVSLVQPETDPLEYQGSVKPSSEEPSYCESDSGYFQDHKEAIPAQPGGAGKSLIISTIDKEVSGDENKVENKSVQDNVDSSSAEGLERDAVQLTDGPNEKLVVFEDENEPECPVLKYERVSISESEEDIKLSTDLAEEQAEEPDTNHLPNVLNGHDESKGDGDLHNGEPAGLTISMVKDVILDDLQEPVEVSDQNQTKAEESALVSDQNQTKAEEPAVMSDQNQTKAEEHMVVSDQNPIKADEPAVVSDQNQTKAEETAVVLDQNQTKAEETIVVLDQNQTKAEEPDEDQVCYMCGGPVSKSSEQDADWLSDVNSTENSSNSDLRCFNQFEASGSCKHKPSEQNNKLNGTVRDLENKANETVSVSKNLLEGKSTLEGVSDGIREFSHSTNGESLDQVSDNTVPGGAKNKRPVSVDYDVSKPEVFVEPFPDVNISEGDENSSASSSRIPGHHPERRPVELRLSLSVTPLQPAPPQRSLTESDTDTEDASEGHSEGVKTKKAKAGSAHFQEQSPFDRHPGEWGAIEPESPAEHFELIKTDMDFSGAGARENTETLREEAVTDANQPITAVHLRKSVDTSQSKGQNGKAIESIKVDTTIINKSLESKTAASPDTSSENVWSDIYILLVAWLLIYCIFVLPQIDSRTLPKLLFNLDE